MALKVFVGLSALGLIFCSGCDNLDKYPFKGVTPIPSPTATRSGYDYLMRGISLTNATVESTRPAVIKLGQVTIPATEVDLVAVVTVQTSCHYFWGTFTNETVHLSVRIGEDPERKAYHELAREFCEHWKNSYYAINEEKDFLPQDKRVFRRGTNYVLYERPADEETDAGFLLWIDGRIIQGSTPWSPRFPGEIATFRINGREVDLEQKTLPPRKIMRLFKQGVFSAFG